jgi:hypothetical protein
MGFGKYIWQDKSILEKCILPFFIVIDKTIILILSSGFPSHKNWYKMSYISVKTCAEGFDMKYIHVGEY